MAMIDDRAKLARAFMAAKNIQSKAQDLLALSGTVTFDNVYKPVDQIVNAYTASVLPMTTLTQTQINNAVARQYPLGAPANTFTALNTFQSAITTFLTAYKAIYDGLGSQFTFAVAQGHQPAPFNTSALDSLDSSLTDIVNAATPLLLDQ